MPSTYSSRLRLNFQAPGDNLNTWGTVLNVGSAQLLEDAIARRVAFTLSGPKTLTTANGADDESRCAFLDVTSGSGGTITIPSVEKLYVVRNATSGDVTVTTGGATNATLKTGETGWVVCDGANVRRVQLTDMGGGRLTGLGAPVNNTDGATKAYVDGQAFGSVNLPGQGPGTVGQFVQSDGTNATWQPVEIADVVGLAAALTPATTSQTITGSVGDRFVPPASLYGAAAPVSVAYAATVTLDLNAGINFDIGALTGNLTLANFTNAKPGQSGIIRLVQDATGGRTLSVGSNLKRPGGALSLTPTANASDRLYYFVWSSTYIDISPARNFS